MATRRKTTTTGTRVGIPARRSSGAILGSSSSAGSSSGEAIGAHIKFRSPHTQPQPMITRTHPASHHATVAKVHARRKVAKHHAGTHHRATVVTGGASPSVVQLHGSDTTLSVALAQHVNPATVIAGGTVAVLVFGEENPSGGLIVGAY